MKTKEELEQIKEEYTKLNNKLADLSEDELKKVTGGLDLPKLWNTTNPSLHKVDL